MKISIIITNYNYGRFLGRSIQSAQAQKGIYDDFEIIVVDDASTDCSAQVLQAYSEGVKILQNEKNMGLPYSVNRAIRASRGMYIIRLDADDWLERNTCFILSCFLDYNREFSFVYPDHVLVNEREDQLARSDKILACGVMFRKQVLVDVGLYDETMEGAEGEDIIIKCIERYKGMHIPLPLYRYFRHSDNMTNDEEKMKKVWEKLKSKSFTGFYMFREVGKSSIE
jgi:glycosyltransferase involved in cell wall biosynthesis